MKSKILVFFLLVAANHQLFSFDSTQYRLALLDGIQRCQFIVEGEIIEAKSYWDEEQTTIYTSYTMELFQVWKQPLGMESTLSSGDRVNVIVKGGTVGNKTMWLTHGPRIELGQKGMYLADISISPDDPNEPSGNTNLNLHNDILLNYDYSKGYVSAKYYKLNFECV